MNQATQTAASQTTGSLWIIVVFIGALVLVGLMYWARSRNKKVSPEQNRRTEEATRELYKDPLDHDTTRETR